MIRSLFFIALLVCGSVAAQDKRFGVRFQLTGERIGYVTDSIVNNSKFFSNMSENDDESCYGSQYKHKTATYKCLNIMPHIGLRFSPINREIISVSINAWGGLGYLHSLKSSTLYIGEDHISNTDYLPKISQITADATFTGSVKINLEKYVYDPFWFALHGGIRFVNSMYSYCAPVGRFEVGFRNFSIFADAYFIKLISYRKLSNGEREASVTYTNNLGFGIQYEID